MKILITKISCFSVFLLLSTHLYSQGIIERPLSINPVIIKKHQEFKGLSAAKSSSITDTLTLDPLVGILDDFSKESPFPDTMVWLDRFVYINREYAKSPITLGVATFDGLNENGYPYDFTRPKLSSDIADYLTSKPIDLNFSASDSIYLSFYYQPQGLGDSPAINDSLVLEFKAPGISPWKHIWAKKGSTLATNDSSWKLVMIPISNPSFLQKGFQFQFHNWATISGNTDHWNIDYVYLNRFRNIHDTLFEDVAFVYNTPSLTKTYTQMPWGHYTASYMKTGYSTTIKNNFKIPKFGSFIYKVDTAGIQVNTTYSGGATNIPVGNVNIPLFTNPSLNYTIPQLNAPQNYCIESVLNSTPDFDRNNDTVRHCQVFANSYAYDDGTAEKEVGLNILNAQLAEKYTSTIADTLRYIDIYFNPYLINASAFPFRLKVWADGSVPGIELFVSDTTLIPSYTSGYNQFVRYELNNPLYLAAGSFFIGFQQKTPTADDYIFVGLDKNINTQDKTFYNVNGSWQNIPFTGSLMMHPVFGKTADFVGISTILNQEKSISVYPNPANDRLYIKYNSSNYSQKITYVVFDLSGRILIEKTSLVLDFIDISSVDEGVYFVRLFDGEIYSTSKFIKIKK